MGPTPIEGALAAAERAVSDGRGLAGTGFWAAVSMVKGEPELVDRYADRIAAIDRSVFEKWAFLALGIVAGTVLMLVATAGGLALIALAYAAEGIWAVLSFYAGLGVLLGTTHGLAHLLVGRLSGMRFTHWFIGAVTRPQPGVKMDYSTYLRADARQRAWMHASGALVTKALPFALIGAAVAADLPTWAVWALPALGAVMIISDITWSTKKSDWMKFKREMRFAQEP
jgi:hypothetical protein